MRQIALFLISGFYFTVNAQPLIDHTSGPVAGDGFIIRSSSYVANEQIGAGQTWDYSGIASGTPFSLEIEDATTSQYADDFPNATIVMTGDGNHTFMDVEPDGLYLHGYRSIFSTVTLLNTSLQLAFPMTMGTVWEDSFSGVQGATMFDGTTDCTANGHGTLIMPYGEVSNVLRIGCSNGQITYISPQLLYLDSVILYYKAGHPWYLIRATRRSIYQNGMLQNVQNTLVYTEPIGTYVDEMIAQDIGIDVFPSPASETLTVNASLPYGEAYLTIHGSDGRLVYSERLRAPVGVAQYTVPVSQLPAGIYLLKITSDQGQTGQKRFLVE